MTPLAALVLDWAITALWPLIGAIGMRHYSGVLFATAGLVVGLWWPPAGFVTPIGLVAYFALAVGFHVRAHDGAHAVTPAVLAVLAAAVVALHAVSS